MILKWAIRHDEYFYVWYFNYILMLILLYFCLSKTLNAGLLLVTEYFYTVVLLLLLKYKIWILLPPLIGTQIHTESLFLYWLISEISWYRLIQLHVCVTVQLYSVYCHTVILCIHVFACVVLLFCAVISVFSSRGQSVITTDKPVNKHITIYVSLSADLNDNTVCVCVCVCVC